VYSIEAFKDVYDVLNLNIKYGNLHNVHSYNLAITDSNGYVYITDSDSHIENKLVNDDSLQNTRKIESVTQAYIRKMRLLSS
jgi:hypothetical protein